MDKKKKIHTAEEALERRRNMTYTERFRLLMRLIRINKMLKNATIIPAPQK